MQLAIRTAARCLVALAQRLLPVLPVLALQRGPAGLPLRPRLLLLLLLLLLVLLLLLLLLLLLSPLRPLGQAALQLLRGSSEQALIAGATRGAAGCRQGPQA